MHSPYLPFNCYLIEFAQQFFRNDLKAQILYPFSDSKRSSRYLS